MRYENFLSISINIFSLLVMFYGLTLHPSPAPSAFSDGWFWIFAGTAIVYTKIVWFDRFIQFIEKRSTI